MKVRKDGLIFTCNTTVSKVAFDLLKRENPKGKLFVEGFDRPIPIGELEYVGDVVEMQMPIFRQDSEWEDFEGCAV